MFGLNGISTLEAPHSAIAKSVQRLNVKVISSHGEIAMPMISADTYRLSIQVPESWPIPSAPRTSASAMDVTWSLNSDVMAAMRTPTRPRKGLISTGRLTLFLMSCDCKYLGARASVRGGTCFLVVRVQRDWV